MSTPKTSRSIPPRASVAMPDRWDLSDLYASEKDWESDLVAVEKGLGALTSFCGRLGEGATVFAEFLRAHIDAKLRLERVVEFASRNSDVDTTDAHALGLKQRALALASTVAAATSFYPAELLALPDEQLDAYATSPELADHRFTLEKVRRQKPYTLSSPEERLLALAGDVTRGPLETFDQLNSADLTFGTIIDEHGETIEVGHGNITSLLTRSDRRVRKAAFEAYHQAFEDHAHVLAALLHSGIRAALFNARARGYASARQAALYPDAIPESVYDNLVSTVNANMQPLYAYYDVLREGLGLDEIAVYDLLAPLAPEVQQGRPYDSAVDVVAAALAPLGDEYVRTLVDGLRGGWVDRYPNKGKVPGAYSAGVYGSRPYILLNYQASELQHVYTMAHEAGHSMHTVYATRIQPPHYAWYSVFVAEVASTFNEVLLTEYLLNNTEDPKARAQILNRELTSIRGLLYRQTALAEFEHRAHAHVQAGRPLTIDVIKAEHNGILKRHFGPDVTMHPLQDIEALRVPHFYFEFYVYQYATGVSAALALSQRVLAGDEAARDAYLSFLAMGGSVHPLDALKAAGVDMTTPEPIEAALSYFSRRVDALKSILNWLD